MIGFFALHPHAAELIGHLPEFLSGNDPRPAREQINENYIYGGWKPMRGWTFNRKTGAIRFPGDPPLEPVAFTLLRDEAILIYPSSWVVILQGDGTFEVARVD